MSEYNPSGSAPKDTKPKEPEGSENRISKGYAYIVGNAQGTATILNFNGIRVLEGGFTTEKYEENLDKLSAIVLSAPTLENLGSTAFYFEKNNGLPVLSHTGILNKVVKSRSGTMFKRIQETAPKSIFAIPVFDPAYRPHIIYQSIEKGVLSMYVLAGTKQEGETIAKALSAEKEENVIKYASQSGMVAVLLWRPNIASEAVVRVLLSGTCSSLRIQESLDRAYETSNSLPFLNSPTVKSSDAFKKTAVPAVPKFVRNSNAAKPTKSVVTAPRQPSMSAANVTPSLAGSGRASSKSSTVSVKGEKPQMSRDVQVSSRGLASTKAQTVGVVTKTVPSNAGAPRSRVTPGSPTVKRTHSMDQKQPIASKRPTENPVVPVTEQTSHPPSRAQEKKPQPAGPSQAKPVQTETVASKVTEPAPEDETQKNSVVCEVAGKLVDKAFDDAFDAASELQKKDGGKSNVSERVKEFVHTISVKAIEDGVKKATSILTVDPTSLGFYGERESSSSEDDPREHQVLRMQTDRKHPPAHKPVKFARSYYFDLVEIPRDTNSMVPENIREFVSKIKSKYLVLSTENVSELQLKSIIDGHRSGHSCTVIPTHPSDILTDFLAKNQSRLTDVHLSFDNPLNKAGDTIEIEKRKIFFD